MDEKMRLEALKHAGFSMWNHDVDGDIRIFLACDGCKDVYRVGRASRFIETSAKAAIFITRHFRHGKPDFDGGGR